MARSSRIGILRERMDGEHRVALTPDGVRALRADGHIVYVEMGAGAGSGFSDDEYRAVGAALAPTTEHVVRNSGVVVKVKGLLPEESPLLPLLHGKTLCCFPHFAGTSREWLQRFLDEQITVFGYETVRDDNGRFPILAPMSAIAGVAAVQYGAHYLQKYCGGLGVLLGNFSPTGHIMTPRILTDFPRAHVVIIGGGIAGYHAAETACGAGALVTLFEKNPETRKYLAGHYRNNLNVIVAGDHPDNKDLFPQSLQNADMVVSAVASPGAHAPVVLTKERVRLMKCGAVIVDIAIDQGGSVEGMVGPTTHKEPIRVLENKVLYCAIPNIPGQFPRQSTPAFSRALLPILSTLAAEGLTLGVLRHPVLESGIQTHTGFITNVAVANDLGMVDGYRNVRDVI
ncbi:MAG: alanine dehydrogenase [Parcubacteria group bacterium]|nr:alanine dehydrogenase [Parcubacteria group bacterium]